ncbi:DUF4442 domain-containing protein [Gilvibacter sp.]|uniref:DUF4442 domain-containing protein n=1 Tax=Gilvibacter sp. TaxID=2729997 RepID=UPI003F49E78D
MALTPGKINTFIAFNLPSAFLTGVRLKSISKESCSTTVKHRWINKNPFKSMFWAVQGMAAELATGALVMDEIKAQGKPVSMLVANNKANFSKKARGRITFICNDGLAIRAAIQKTIETGEGQTCWMHAEGTNSDGVVVSSFDFEWTVKLRS